MTDLVAMLRPSSASTWIVCAGHVAMRAAFPEIPDEADDEVREDGTACHWLAAEIWQGLQHREGEHSPNHRVLTEEMFDAVDVYHDALRSVPGVEVYLERQVDCSTIYPGMAGTPDAWAFDPSTYTLHVWDLKFGFRFVEVWENWQLMVYAISLMAMLNINGLQDRALKVKLTIVQPRSNHRDGIVRTWTVNGDDLRAYANILRAAAADAMKPNPRCVPNPGCNDCPGRHACTALQHSALTALEVSYAGVPLELTPDACGDELRRLKAGAKRMEARITGLEMQAEAMLKSGKVVPHWQLGATFARETWREGAESQVLTLGKLLNADLAKPAKAITPNQARKLIPTALVAVYAHKPSTGMRLQPLDPFEAKKKFTT